MRLTPNQRLAEYLKEVQPENEKAILPIHLWLEKLYSQSQVSEIQPVPLLLSSFEQTMVWESIIKQSEIGQRLLKPNLSARLAMEAWHLRCAWDLKDFETPFQTEDVQTYLNWQADYKQHLQKNQWIDTAQLVEWLIQAIQNQQLNVPSHIQLIGFEELTPQLTRLFDTLRNKGSQVDAISLVSTTAGSVYRLAVDNREEELRYAAMMVKQWSSPANENTIAVVVPDLEQCRSEVIRIFKEVFPKDVFNVSAPIPLSTYPLCAKALLILRMFIGEIDLEEFSLILRSPFLGDSIKEQDARVFVDLFLRKEGERFFSLESLIKKLEYIESKENLQLSGLLQRLKNGLAKKHPLLQSKRLAIEWSPIILELLENMGWPGERSLNKDEYQLKHRWDQLLLEYVQLDRVLGLHTFRESLNCITRLMQETPFLPKSPKVKIQILGLLEAVGIPFDFLWIVGLHRDAWPADPNPNPFIPFILQKEKGLPRSSAARELTVAKRMMERFCQGAKTVIFSYPLMIEDRSCQCSTLLKNIPETTKEVLGLKKPSSYLESLAEFKKVEDNLQTQVLLNEEEPITVSGGTRLFKLQALCPFRAFAEIRLKAKPIPRISVGLTPKEKGEILHEILKLFWRNLPDQAALLVLSEEDLKIKILKNIDDVLKKWVIRRPSILKKHYYSLEKSRLFKLIWDFIELEKSRKAFTVIAKELEREVVFNNISFKVCIDRIDRLPNGEEVVIDYKTGDVSITDWFGERPRDPQLPMYGITHETLPAGIAFAVLRPEGIKFQGLLKEEDLLPGGKTVQQVKRWGSEESYEKQYETWKNTLGSLAEDFKAGIAIVDPLEGINTCRLCSLKTLCRVNHNPQA